ncbi:MAG: pheromone shutdown protein TraB [Candidatus Nanohaloarchaea archaeon]
MIHIFGTSHVSQESLDLVEEKIEEIDPEVVALELDPLRLNSLLNGQQENRGGPLFVQVLQYFQKSIGEKTGVMPGEEMLLAYQTAEKNDIDVALIDQDIRITINKLKDVSFWEKLKAGAQLLVGLIFPGSFEIANEIPEEELIDQLLFEMEFKFPEMYDVLVEQRNKHMSESLKMLEEDTDGDIVAFVGAAHRKALVEEFE